MKILSVTCLSLLLMLPAVAAKKKCLITVTNPVKIARTAETIELRIPDLLKKAKWLGPDNLVVISQPNGDTLVTQRLGALILFQTDLAPREKKTFVVANAEELLPARRSLVDAKYILPRKDVAWENDRIAFRIYGGPLAGNVKNGLDVWVKRVEYPIIDKWYAGDSLKGKDRISYHVDHGEGADMFEVGRSLGGGACALLVDNVLCQPGLFTTQTISAIGPIRAQFLVIYDRDSVNGKPYYEEVTYSLDAGQNLNRIEVHYTGPGIPKKYTIAAGLVKRNNTVHTTSSKQGWLGLWGPVNDDTSNGSLGTGIVFPANAFKGIREDSTHYLITGTGKAGGTFTYYAGAGWTRSMQFADVAAWNKYLSDMSVRLRNPLTLRISVK